MPEEKFIDKTFFTKVRKIEKKSPDHKIGLIIQFKTKVSEEKLEKLREQGCEIIAVHKLTNMVSVKVPVSMVMILAEEKEVEEVHEDLTVYTMLNDSVSLINANKMWAEGFDGKDVLVAVIDTGIDEDHPDLKNRVIKEVDFTGEGPFDGHGHGTHVAGIIGGNGTASEKVYVGVAPGVKFLAAKALNSHGQGTLTTIIQGIEWAVENNAQVINLSLGTPQNGDGTDPLSRTCDAAVEEGIVVCVAAGNSGPEKGTVGIPAVARKVITIGATDKDDKIAYFSSRGPTLDGRHKPDICMPGVNIASARAAGTSMGLPIDEDYTRASGTSMATPHASGIAALLIEAYPNITPDEVKSRMMDTAKDIGEDIDTQGSGRADAYDAYKLEPKLILEKQVDKETVVLGNDLNIAVTTENRGRTDAINAELVDTYPESFELVEGSVNWSYEKLAPADIKSYSYKLRPTIIGDFKLEPCKVTYHDKNGNEYNTQSNDLNINVVKKPCILATASFNDQTELQPLRNFRDDVLEKNILGRLFIDFYYDLGCLLVPFVERSNTLKRTIEWTVRNFVLRFLKK